MKEKLERVRRIDMSSRPRVPNALTLDLFDRDAVLGAVKQLELEVRLEGSAAERRESDTQGDSGTGSDAVPTEIAGGGSGELQLQRTEE